MINKILIANRGEIACRIIKTAKRMGIQTVAVYSEADTKALHVKLADEAYFLGPSASKESYLNIKKIIQIASNANVQAIHPGYGFLAENAEFAKQCEKAQIIFIGPPVSAIEAMGSKSVAKQIMAKANVPLVPGYHDTAQETDVFLNAAKKIGYPVLLKASAGGGGKGMRIVQEPTELADAINSAKREAKTSFNDDTLLLEKYVQKPRHVEIQIFADAQGNCVYLFERDCSIQRRHQKIIEEAPAPKMPSKLREEMGKAAIAAAQAVQYVGAGTVEFLLDEKNQFYFMEMNTRLQVEHPVTEMITKYDLVEWQILIANGKPLPHKQSEIKLQGHAFEVRIYAEDPNNQFLPSTGQINYCQFPIENENVRVDTGIEEGDTITPFYDPMIAKLITWSNTRDEAAQHMSKALSELHLIGVKNNIAFLQKIFKNHDFLSGNFDTNFITNNPALFQSNLNPPNKVFALASLFYVLKQKKSNQNFPWMNNPAWRLNATPTMCIRFALNGEFITSTIEAQSESYQIKISNDVFLVNATLNQSNLTANFINEDVISAKIIEEAHHLHLFVFDEHFQVTKEDPFVQYETNEEARGNLNAPMPGTVVALLTKPGNSVKRGDKLIIIEAMKMEHTIQSPMDGVISEIHYEIGDMVDEGVELLRIKQ
ncbi:MAG: acetyl-CoA carboxylase biotin carboxylase subunit [Gammaproteobacteria bacterium]